MNHLPSRSIIAVNSLCMLRLLWELKARFPPFQLFLHLRRRGRAIRAKRLDGVFDPEHAADLGAELGMRLGELGVGEVGQALEAPALALADQPADDLVRGPLGDAPLDQELHQS